MIKEKPSFMEELPYAPMNWEMRDRITRRILDIIEASIPEGKQQEAIKHLVKEATKQCFEDIFGSMFEYLSNLETKPLTTISNHSGYYMEAIWAAYIEHSKSVNAKAKTTIN